MRYMGCEYFLPSWRLPVQFIDCFLCCAGGFQLDVIPLVYFSFVTCAFGVLSKKSLIRLMSVIFSPKFFLEI